MPEALQNGIHQVSTPTYVDHPHDLVGTCCRAKAVTIDAVTESLGKITLPLAQQLTPVLQQQLQPAGIEVSVDDIKHFVTIVMNTVMPALIDAIGAMCVHPPTHCCC